MQCSLRRSKGITIADLIDVAMSMIECHDHYGGWPDPKVKVGVIISNEAQWGDRGYLAAMDATRQMYDYHESLLESEPESEPGDFDHDTGEAAGGEL